MFREFIKTRLIDISCIAEYVLVHLHTTSLHVIDDFLKITGIKAFELDIDEGGRKINSYIDEIKKIQYADKNIIIKGRFDIDDLKIILKKFDRRGLCLMPVVTTKKEIEEICSILGYK